MDFASCNCQGFANQALTAEQKAKFGRTISGTAPVVPQGVADSATMQSSGRQDVTWLTQPQAPTLNVTSIPCDAPAPSEVADATPSHIDEEAAQVEALEDVAREATEVGDAAQQYRGACQWRCHGVWSHFRTWDSEGSMAAHRTSCP